MKARLAAAAAFVLLQLPVFRTGLFVADEGWMVHAALRIARGEALYRDVHTYLPPLSYWLLAIPMRLHPTLLWGRLLSLSMCGAFGYLGAAITERAGRAAQLLALGGLAFLGSAGYPSYTIPSYTGLSLLMALAAWRLWDVGGNPVLAGAALAAALLFKQTTGVASAVAIVIAESLERRLPVRRLAIGLLVPCLAALGIVAAQGALPAMTSALSPSSMGQYRAMGKVPMPSWRDLDPPRLCYTLPFLVDLTPSVMRGGTAWAIARGLVMLLYWAPLPVCAAAIFRARAVRDRSLALLALLAFSTVMPRADVAHLMQVLPPVALVLAVLGGKRPALAATAGAALLLASLGLQGLRSVRASVALDVPRDGGLHVLPEQAAARGIVTALAERPGAPMLAAPWGALYYFLADRPNPTRYELLLPGNVGREGMKEVLAALEARPPADVVWSTVDLRNLTPVTFEQFFPDLAAWRDRHYARTMEAGGEELWRRR